MTQTAYRVGLCEATQTDQRMTLEYRENESKADTLTRCRGTSVSEVEQSAQRRTRTLCVNVLEGFHNKSRYAL